MARFCGNCGTPLEDNAKICGNCGTPLEDTSVSVRGLKAADSEKQKKTVKLIVSLAVLILIVVVTINVVSQYTGYNGLLRKVMTAYENCDIDTLISLSSDMYCYGEEDWAEYYFKYSVEDDLDSFESSVGHSYKLSYEVDEIYTVSEWKLNDMLERIEYSYSDFDVSKIEKIVIADLTVTAKQGSKSVNRDIDIVMSKEDGTWRLLYIEK